MELETSGHPLHSRALSVTLLRGAGRQRRAEGSLLDLRKRGFVPVAGDLQTSGIVHHMQVAAVYDERSLELAEIATVQPTVAFEASPTTGGESCRDPAGRLASLAGRPLDAAFPAALGAGIGGPRGCTHVLTLTQLVASTAPWVRRREAELFAEPPRWHEGERLFRAVLVYDASVRRDGAVDLAAQLLQIHLAPAGERPRPMDRFAGQLELRLLAEVDPQAMQLAGVRAAERRRGLDDLETAGWRDLAPLLADLPGLPLGPGVSGGLVRRFADLPDERPLLDVLLNLTPAWFQSLAALQERWPAQARADAGFIGVGGRLDSCYMWRSEGALQRARLADEEKP